MRDLLITPDHLEIFKRENSALAKEIDDYNSQIEDAVLAMEMLNGDPSKMNEKVRRIYELSRIPSDAYHKFSEWDSSKYQSAVDVDYPFTPEEKEMLEKVKVWLSPKVTVSMAVKNAKKILNDLTELSKKKPRDFEAEVMDIAMNFDPHLSFFDYSIGVCNISKGPRSRLNPTLLSVSVSLCPICEKLMGQIASKHACY